MDISMKMAGLEDRITTAGRGPPDSTLFLGHSSSDISDESQVGFNTFTLVSARSIA